MGNENTAQLIESEPVQSTEILTQPNNNVVSLTPDQMLSIVVQSDAGIEKIQQFMDLKERWEKSEAVKAFVRAMAAFKANPPKITKNKHVKYKTKTGSITDYKHASLDHVCEMVGAALGKVGMSYHWETNQEGAIITVRCVLTHELGHTKSVQLYAAPDATGNKNGIQAVGSTVSYLQRYTLLAITGLATEDQDDDGQGAENKPLDTTQHQTDQNQSGDYYPNADFERNFPKWERQIVSGEKTASKIITFLGKKGIKLSPTQTSQLNKVGK